MDPNTIIVAISGVSRDWVVTETYDGKAIRVPGRFDFTVQPIEGNMTLDFVSDAHKNGTKFKLVPMEE